MTTTNAHKSNRLKFLIAGALFVLAVIFMVISATKATAEFFMTVREMQESTAHLSGQNIRVSGAVLGDSINYNSVTGQLNFTIAHIPGTDEEINAQGGLSQVLHDAVNNSENPRLRVAYDGPQPDMLKDEAQAILTGRLGNDGVFIAEELLLKCPSKYEEAIPDQVDN